MQTMKLTLELPYDPQVVSMLLAASSAAMQVEAHQAPKPVEQQSEAAGTEPEPEPTPAPTPTPEAAGSEPEAEVKPEAVPATPAPKRTTRKAAAKTAETPELKNAPETLEAAAQQPAPEAAEPETPTPAPQAPAGGVSMNDIRKEAVRLAQNGKQKELREVLEGLGANAVSQIPTERYDEALAAMQAFKTEAAA